MECFNLLSNKLINSIDEIAKERPDPTPLKNSLKTLVKAHNKTMFGSQSIVYGRRFTLEIPKEYDNLAQLYVKCTLSTGNAASTVKTYLATKIFKYIRIRTKNGLVLQTFTPRYLQSRIDEVYNDPIYTYLQLQVEPDRTFASGDPTVFVPIFAFFSESENTFLRTRSLEQLEVEFIVNDTKESMGMSASLTSLDAELYCLYHDVNNSNNLRQYEKKSESLLPRYIKNSYTIFEEDTTVISSNSTSARILLRCPHPLFSLNLSLVDADSDKKQIKTMKLFFGDNCVLDLDYRINYQNYGHNKSFLASGVMNYFFNKMKERSVDSGLITFTEEMAPVYLEITFDQLTSDYTLYIFEEYRTSFNVDDKGYIKLSNDIEGWREGLLQLNSGEGDRF